MRHWMGYPGHEVLIHDITHADNCYLYSAEGKRYIDLESGIWCTAIGHGHPRIQQVIVEQLAKIAHTGYCYSNGTVEAAAQRILSLLDFQDGKCVFLCSGSEAVEYGVRLIQTIIERPLLLTMTDSYFGAYGSARSRHPDEWFSFDWSPCASCPDTEDCGESCPHWAKIPFQEIAGFLFEPGSSSGLVRFAPKKLIQHIAAEIRANNGYVLVNEVTTGLGRTGRWFGFEHYGLNPDVVAIGKSIGNGYPVSVTAFGAHVIERLEGKSVAYAQSHQNDPLGAAVALEVTRSIDELGLIERGREIALALTTGLEEIKARTGKITEIRSRGLMMAIEIDDEPDAAFTQHIQQELVRRGYILAQRPGLNVLRLDPSLTIERGDIEDFLEVFEQVLSAASPVGPY